MAIGEIEGLVAGQRAVQRVLLDEEVQRRLLKETFWVARSRGGLRLPRGGRWPGRLRPTAGLRAAAGRIRPAPRQ